MTIAVDSGHMALNQTTEIGSFALSFLYEMSFRINTLFSVKLLMHFWCRFQNFRNLLIN